MRVLNRVIFICALVCITIPAWAVEITPSNVTMPTIALDTFSFDLVISDSDPIGLNGLACKTTISVVPSVIPSGLTFDVSGSEAVESDTSYWIYGNSGGGSFAQDLGSDSYAFSDGPSIPEDLMSGEILSRYAFTWDGVAKDYTFTIDLDTAKSYVLTSIIPDTREAFEFNPGIYPGTNSFI
ncbi:MAG: hypothetical protein AMJ43_07590 [Coxiella sp. DG_40]|nr:MAG: hypothetical protein AMJ43_07590 [Coxiella sp. DG_40]